ncbi:MAG: hypothetical protein M5U12_31830 [Verrucomicrobia bacterium]|nr:hypothetical protein [Verrucomicrobiota bacterium]
MRTPASPRWRPVSRGGVTKATCSGWPRPSSTRGWRRTSQPLWPIDDLLAQHIALEFYRHLLSERLTLGEALRRAKAEARRVSYPDEAEGELPAGGAWAGLGWASLVLYGDPTEELFQALAGSGRSRTEETEEARPRVPAVRVKRPPELSGPARVVHYLHAPDHVLSEWVSGPALAAPPLRPAAWRSWARTMWCSSWSKRRGCVDGVAAPARARGRVRGDADAARRSAGMVCPVPTWPVCCMTTGCGIAWRASGGAA